MLKILVRVAISISAVSFACGATCSQFSGSLPCVEVPKCNTGHKGKLTIDKLSSGLSASKSTSNIEICYDDKYLKVKNTALKQAYYSDHHFEECNDSVFNSDISEMFIAPWSEQEPTPHCYSELDVNPSNLIFESGIYNPNLNHTGISGKVLDCAASGVVHSVIKSGAEHSWTETISVPWSVVDYPAGCPKAAATSGLDIRNLESASAAGSDKHISSVYRANFFRVNELVSVPTCSSSTCEYMAWSPTGCTPPAFHEPTKFGYLVLV